jgi:hypothetical protein
MNNQLLLALALELCELAGSNRGASPGRLYLKKALRCLAQPDAGETPRIQGWQMLKWLKIEIAEWNSEIHLERGDHLTADQCREVFRLLLNLDGLDMNSEDRRLKAIDILELKRCGFQRWRSKCIKGKLIGVEVEFLEHLARHFVEYFPERAALYTAS